MSVLLKMKSDLTDLKFGADQPGYGSSGLPYIQTKLPVSSPNSPGIVPIYKPGSSGLLDYPLRGGIIETQVGQQVFTPFSRVDKTRIKKFFEDKTKGPLFIQKQIGLQLSNPKIETGNTLFGLGQGTPVPGLLENTRVYNRGLNTLAQVGVQGSGAHAVRHGLVPFNNFQKNYFAIVNKQNLDNEGATNRLLNLNALKMTAAVSPFVNPQDILDLNTVNTLGISLNKNILFQYLGGPGSVYGLGNTTIKRSVDTTQLGVTKFVSAGRNAMTYNTIKAQTVNSTISEENKSRVYNIQDFRDQTGTPHASWQGLAGQSSRKIQDRFYYSVPNGRGADYMNSSYPFLFYSDQEPWSVVGKEKETDDLIKFVFEAISNDDTAFSTAIFFRAFLMGSITDNHSGQWNNFKYLGRGESFYTYQGFDRSMGFSFRLAAESGQELRPMYNRLNNLISQVYPDYSPQSGIMRAPIIRLTIGDYIYRMPGFLESVNVTIEGGTPWDINYYELENELVAQVPQVIDVSVNFKPILNELPKRAQIQFINKSTTVTETDSSITTTEKQSVSEEVTQIIVNNNRFIKKRLDSDLERSIVTSVKKDPPKQQPLPIEPRRIEPVPVKTGEIPTYIRAKTPPKEQEKKSIFDGFKNFFNSRDFGGGGSSGGGGATGGW